MQSNDFLHWSFGEQAYGSPVTARSADFRLWFSPSVKNESRHFREEVINAAKILNQEREGKKIALCHAGGIYSETIALTLKELNIPFSLYFLNFWELNQNSLETFVRPLAEKLNVELKVIRVSRNQLREESTKKYFRSFGCELPSYLAMLHLFDQIPSEEFIVTGDGNLDREGGIFQHIADSYPNQESHTGHIVPFSVASIVYLLWANQMNRRGQYYFFRSTPELLAASLKHPKFARNSPFFSAREVIFTEYPEISLRAKSSNFDPKGAESTFLRRYYEYYAESLEGFENWKKLIGANVDLKQLFYS